MTERSSDLDVCRRATGAGADVLEGTLVVLGGIVPILVVWVLPLALVWRLIRRRGS